MLYFNSRYLIDYNYTRIVLFTYKLEVLKSYVIEKMNANFLLLLNEKAIKYTDKSNNFVHKNLFTNFNFHH